eukprot:TRINITY_DN172_c0_g1_i1.p1 TRINITY_DN172_c0_g1~~TRINITY_DN172_c0_g1_i1.p1  ORF type:complete len:293 (+),score=35.04 TRINITY_DN172_c0_g1_i1:645-1523(+)
MQATDLPSSVQFFQKFEEIEAGLKEIKELRTTEDLGERIARAVHQALEDRAAAFDQLTPDKMLELANLQAERSCSKMSTLLKELAERLGVTDLEGAIRVNGANGSTEDCVDEWKCFERGDRDDRVVPEDWEPALQTTWPRGAELWYLGIPSQRIRPLREMHGCDMPTTRARRHLEDFRSVFKLCESFVGKTKSGRHPPPSVLVSSAARPSAARSSLQQLRVAIDTLRPLFARACTAPDHKADRSAVVSRLKVSTLGKRMRGKSGASMLKIAVKDVKHARKEAKRANADGGEK